MVSSQETITVCHQCAWWPCALQQRQPFTLPINYVTNLHSVIPLLLLLLLLFLLLLLLLMMTCQPTDIDGCAAAGGNLCADLANSNKLCYDLPASIARTSLHPYKCGCVDDYAWDDTHAACAACISVVAGETGEGGWSGDGGLAINAQLNWPIDVTVDASGNLYIAGGRAQNCEC
jgi:hypothetical protein